MGVQVQIGSTLGAFETRAARVVRARALKASYRSRSRHCMTLTPRLERLADLMARGYSYKECASRMEITEGTAKSMGSDVLTRLGLSGQAALRAWWYRREFRKWAAKFGGQLSDDAMKELAVLFDSSEAQKDRWLD